MYSLMLVEDEPIVLEGMLKIIDFEALGFKVVSACSNGVEALDSFKKFKPDVVITDICMEFMDGLEFIENVYDQASHTKFVIISGHQDFKFFKKALSLKVTDYILKPVTAKEFRELLIKISKELSSNNMNINNQIFDENQKLYEIERNMFFNKLMHLKMNKEEVHTKLKTFNISFNKEKFQVAIFKINNLTETANLKEYKSSEDLLNDLFKKIKSIIENDENKVAFIDPQGLVILIVNNDNIEFLEKDIRNISKKVHNIYVANNSNNNTGIVDCYVGIEVDNIMDLSKSFKSANRLNICGVLANKNAYYLSEKILFTRANRKYDYIEDTNQWIKGIIFRDSNSVNILEKMFQKFYDSGFLLTDFRVAATRMKDTLKKEISLVGKKIDHELDVNFDILSEDEIKKYLFKITKSCSEGNNRVSTENYIATKAVKYIEESYMDANLDLQQVCESLGISVSYFSNSFKKYTGMTFVKYLNNYRIEKSKYFLKYTDDSISEISEKVGYVEPHYFGIVFKKYTGITPKKYRMIKYE